ncbi:MAG: hypothetical protein ACKVWV_13695, partial [Planctomycetota bacterium]
ALTKLDLLCAGGVGRVRKPDRLPAPSRLASDDDLDLGESELLTQDTRATRRTAQAADDPSLMEEGILVVAVWAADSSESIDARSQIETALLPDACNAVLNPGISN